MQKILVIKQFCMLYNATLLENMAVLKLSVEGLKKPHNLAQIYQFFETFMRFPK
jgi:hypothetical protein